MKDRLALSVLKMKDAVFKGYGGAAYTHCSGGGLLQPNDFHGVAALLVESRSAQSDATRQEMTRRRAALERLIDPVNGNPIVQKTLACLLREVDGAQPTIPEKESSEDEADEEAQPHTVLLEPEEFVGAAVSMLPPGEAASSVAVRQDASIGDRQSRRGTVSKQSPQAESSQTSADVAANDVLFPKGDGGFANKETGCTRTHYTHKMLGSVSHPFRRSIEVCSRHGGIHCACKAS